MVNVIILLVFKPKMSSKRQKKALKKLLDRKQQFLDIEMLDLMIGEMKFQNRLQNKALRMARKRKIEYIQ